MAALHRTELTGDTVMKLNTLILRGVSNEVQGEIRLPCRYTASSSNSGPDSNATQDSMVLMLETLDMDKDAVWNCWPH